MSDAQHRTQSISVTLSNCFVNRFAPIYRWNDWTGSVFVIDLRSSSTRVASRTFGLWKGNTDSQPWNLQGSVNSLDIDGRDLAVTGSSFEYLSSEVTSATHSRGIYTVSTLLTFAQDTLGSLTWTICGLRKGSGLD